MIQLFLKAKHWQLFLIFFAAPLIIQFVAMGSFMNSIPFDVDVEPDPEEIAGTFRNFFQLIPIIMLPMILGFSGWIWSISVGLYPKLPPNHGLKLNLFKGTLIASLVIMIFYFYFLINAFGGMFEMMEDSTEITEMPSWIGQILMMFPLLLIALGCSIYTYYHTAKTLKLVEVGDTKPKPEFVGEFFMIWFYYIGVWIIQPKVNKMQLEDYITPSKDDSTTDMTYDN